MMTPDPFLVLDLPEDADDAAIRGAYLDLVRRHPPESHPQQFQAIADAYQAIKDPVDRARRLLFGNVPPPEEPLHELVPPVPSARRSVGVERWLKLLGEARHEH